MRRDGMRWELDNDLARIPELVGVLEARLAESGFSDAAGRVEIAVALREALVNAIVHGNLELSSELCESDPDAYERLATERRESAPFCERRVVVTVDASEDGWTYVITDEGPGFDPSSLPDPTDPENLERGFGRGLFIVRSVMDEVTHEQGGRTIRMTKRRP